jgi:hypothetical protein
MKSTIKFATVCFGLQILFVSAMYIIYPEIYPGDSFTIIWFYVVNLILGIFLLPVFSLLFTKVYFNRKISYVLTYFLFILIIINIIPLFIAHVIYTVKIVSSIFKHTEMKAAAIIEFINPIVSFAISYLFFRNSRLWKRNTYNIPPWIAR